MTWGELLNSGAVGASILGAILGLVTWALSARTDRLIRAVHEVSQAARAEARHRETRE